MIARNSFSDNKINFLSLNLKENESKNETKKSGVSNFYDILSETLKDTQSNADISAKSLINLNSWNQNGKNTIPSAGSFNNYDYYNYKAAAPLKEALPVVLEDKGLNSGISSDDRLSYEEYNEEKISNAEDLNSNSEVEEPEEKEAGDINAETQKTQNEEESEPSEKVEKYLQEVFGGVVNFRVSSQNEQNKINENSVKSDPNSNPGISTREQAFLTKLNEYMSKAMPDVDLSKLKIEVVSVNFSKKDSGQKIDNSKNKGASFANMLAGAVNKDGSQSQVKEKKSDGGDLKNNLKNGSEKNENLKHFLTPENTGNGKILSDNSPLNVESNNKIDRSAVIDQVKNQMADLKSSLSAKSGVYSTQIILNPESLGKISVEITMQNGEVRAKFISEKAETQEILMAATEKLKESIAEKGLKVVNVEFSNDSSMFMSKHENSGRQQGNDKNFAGGNGNNGNNRAGTGENKPWMAGVMENTGSERITDSILTDQVLNVRI